jgi:hypothetical protein
MGEAAPGLGGGDTAGRIAYYPSQDTFLFQ